MRQTRRQKSWNRGRPPVGVFNPACASSAAAPAEPQAGWGVGTRLAHRGACEVWHRRESVPGRVSLAPSRDLVMKQLLDRVQRNWGVSRASWLSIPPALAPATAPILLRPVTARAFRNMDEYVDSARCCDPDSTKGLRVARIKREPAGPEFLSRRRSAPRWQFSHASRHSCMPWEGPDDPS